VFFPAHDAATQQLGALSAFALAFLIRPVGGAVWGPLGDRIGRKRVLAMTMLMMSAGTFMIALIPGQNRIGLAAPILLFGARLIQGFSTGGEYGGAMIFISEYAPPHRRGFLGSWLEFGTCGGFLLGAAMAAMLTTWLPAAALDDWGWRLPFLLSAPFGLIGFYIRSQLAETPAFRNLPVAVATSSRARTHGRALLDQWRPALLCMALVTAFNVPDFIVLSFMPSYITTTLGVAENQGLLLSSLVLALMMGLIPLAGWLGDRIGRRSMIMACCGLHLLLSIPCFMLIRSGTMGGMFAGLMVMGIVLAGLIGTMPATLPLLFPTRVRYASLAIAYNIAVTVFGGTSVPIVAALIQRTGDALIPAYYLIATSCIGLMAAISMSEPGLEP
jgi:MHS family proline/betaine transporter-like MFS transporter